MKIISMLFVVASAFTILPVATATLTTKETEGIQGTESAYDKNLRGSNEGRKLFKAAKAVPSSYSR